MTEAAVNLKRRASDQPFAHIGHEWVDDVLEKQYRELMEEIENIRRAAMTQCEPIAKLAARLHTIGTRPYLIQVVKP